MAHTRTRSMLEENLRSKAAGVLRLLSVLLGAGLASVCGGAHAANVFVSPPFAVFEATTSPDTSAIGFSLASDGTNYLFGLQVADTGVHDHVKAQLVSHSGVPIGPTIDTGRTGGIPFAAFDGTNYLLVWDDSGNYGYGLSAQLVGASGTLVGSTIDITRPSEVSATTTELGLSDRAVSFDGSNYFVVFNTGYSGDSVDLYAVFVSTSGTRVGPIIPICTAVHQQRDYAVGFDGANFLVAWADGRRFAQTGTDPCTGNPAHFPTDIYGQFVSKSSAGTPGALAGSNFVVNQNDFASDNPPTVAFDGANYLVGWADETVLGSACVDGEESGGRWGTYGQLISTSGVAAGGVIPIATTDDNRNQMGLGAFGGNEYLWVAMVSGETTNGWDIHGRLMSKAGALLGSEFVINDAPQDQFYANVLFAGGQFVTVWNSGVASKESHGSVFGAFVSRGTCVSDCGGDDRVVTIDEILTMVNIALGSRPVDDCLPGDANGDDRITVDEILTAVNHALNGCA